MTTIPEYLRKRYNRERISIYITAITLLMYAIIKIAINIYSGTLFIEMAMGWSQYASVIGPARQNYLAVGVALLRGCSDTWVCIFLTALKSFLQLLE